MKDKLETIKKLIFETDIPYSDFNAFFTKSEDLSLLIIEILKEALQNKNNRALNQGLYSMSLNGFIDERYTEVLLDILKSNEEWNHTHEIVCEYLETIKDPRSIEPLFTACLKHQSSDLHNIPLKVIWALTSIGSNESIEALKKLRLHGSARTSSIAKKYLNSFDKDIAEPD